MPLPGLERGLFKERQKEMRKVTAAHRKIQTRRAAEDSTRLYGAGFPKKWLRHFLGCPVSGATADEALGCLQFEKSPSPAKRGSVGEGG